MHDEARIGLARMDTSADNSVFLVFVNRQVILVIELLRVYLKRCAARLARELIDLGSNGELRHLEAT